MSPDKTCFPMKRIIDLRSDTLTKPSPLSLIFAGIILVFAVGGVALGPIVFMFEFAAIRNKDQG